MTKNHQKPTRQYGGVDAAQRLKERREKFIAAGLEAFGADGYGQASVKKICRLAGLTERYFYESFENKEDLLCGVFRQLTAELEAEAQQIIEIPGIAPRDAIRRTLENFFGRFADDPRRARIQLFEVLGVSPRVDREYRESLQVLARWVEISWLALFPDIDRDWLRSTIIPVSTAGGVIAVAHHWVLDGFTTPVADIVAQAMEMLTALGCYYQEKHRV
ncbi:MAG: TetR/AcrR family transcriptional regulator [Thermodesulfobacteriota bacterium]|nr:TetR/AcrR family transcriptional regulator [Thermodesulfobacteriota bacterium]